VLAARLPPDPATPQLCRKKREAWTLDGNVPPTFAERDARLWNAGVERFDVDARTGQRLTAECSAQHARNPRNSRAGLRSHRRGCPTKRARPRPCPRARPIANPTVAMRPSRCASTASSTARRSRAIEQHGAAATLVRALGSEARIRWLIDGRMVGETRGAAPFAFDFAEHGAHTLTALAETGAWSAIGFPRDGVGVAQLLEHVLGRRNAELARRFDMQLLHHAVFGVQREALGARAHAVTARVHLEPERAREIAVAVGQHFQALRHVLRFAPGLHHEGIVDRHAEHFDAARREVFVVLHEAGQVALRARRRERAGHREQQHLLAVEQRARIHGFHAFADALEGDFGMRSPIWMDMGESSMGGRPPSLGDDPASTALR
jgi:hypothetical protein